MPRKINDQECIACGTCEEKCLTGCITETESGTRFIDPNGCVDCGACQLTCPVQCISED